MTALLRRPADLTMGLHLRAALHSIGRDLAQTGLTLVFLPFEAYSNLDAVVRTVVRMSLTHTHLLEWTTSSEAARTSRADRLVDIVRAMAIAPGTRGRACARARIFEAGGTGRGNALARPVVGLAALSHGGSAGPQPEARPS